MKSHLILTMRRPSQSTLENLFLKLVGSWDSSGKVEQTRRLFHLFILWCRENYTEKALRGYVPATPAEANARWQSAASPRSDRTSLQQLQSMGKRRKPVQSPRK